MELYREISGSFWERDTRSGMLRGDKGSMMEHGFGVAEMNVRMGNAAIRSDRTACYSGDVLENVQGFRTC